MTDRLIPTVVLDLAEAWKSLTREPDFGLSPDHCINGTRVAVTVLARCGVKAKPVSVRVTVFNRFAWDLYQAGVHAPEWPEHAWSVGVDEHAPVARGRWPGHLICEGDGWTLDVSAAQFHRPGLITVDGPLWFAGNVPPVGREIVYKGDFDQRVLIARTPRNNAWRRAPGWQPTSVNRRLVARVMNVMTGEPDKDPDHEQVRVDPLRHR